LFQLIAPITLVATLLSAPRLPLAVTHTIAAPVTARPSSVEIYQLSLVGPGGGGGGAALQNLVLVIQADENAYTGFVLSNARSTQLDSVVVHGEVLHAALPTTGGPGELTLTISAGGVQGTLTVHGNAIAVSGERTL
jgi:hypothetical protein